MALIPLEKAIAKARANQNKNEKYSTTSLMSPNDARAQQEIGMQQRRTAFENYKAARAAMQQQAQRQVTQGYERRADAMGTVAREYGQSNMPTVAKKTAYENYTYALKQKELRQKQMSGKPLTPAEQIFLNTKVYRDPAQAANAENNQYQNQAVQNVEERGTISKAKFDHTPELVKQYGSYANYKRSLYGEEAVNVMKAREQEIDAQISGLEEAIANAHFEDTSTPEAWEASYQKQVMEGKAPSITEMERQLSGLETEKMQTQSARAMKRSHMAIDPLNDRTKALLREYNSGGMYTREYAKQNGGQGLSKLEARQDLLSMGYSEDEIKSLAEYEQRLRDYENAEEQAKQTYQFGQEHPIISSAITPLMAPFKALGNVESVRGILPKGLGGYQNEDMPTNIYSPWFNASRVSGNIRSAVSQDMSPTGKFVYDAGMSALDSAVNMGASIALVGAAGGGSGAAAQDAVANTMNFVMGSEVAADSVYEGIQNGKSNVNALIDGIVEGAIEGITEKYSVGDIIETMLSGKAAWRKIVRAFASEGAEEVASNWLNRLYDVTMKHGRGDVEAAYYAYLDRGMGEREALGAMLKDFAQEDGLSFLAGGLSGWMMSGTYAALGKGASEANIQWTAAQAIQRGEVQDVIDLGLAQGEGAAFDRAAALQGKLDGGAEPTQSEVAGVLRAYVREQQEAAEEAQSGGSTQEERTYQNFKNAVQDVEQAQNEFDINSRRKAVYDAEAAGEITREEADARLDALDSEEAINRSEAEHVQAGVSTREAEDLQHANDARSSLRSQQERENEIFERQTEQQSTDTVRKAGAQYGWNAPLTETAAKGYAAYSRSSSGALSAAEYADAINQAYQYGTVGAGLDAAQEAAQGVQKNVIRAAWTAGKENGNGEAGKAAADDGGKRNAGVDSGKQSGGVAEGAGRAETRSSKKGEAAERIELENRVRDAKRPYLSGKEIGIQNGSTKKTLQDIPESLWTPRLRTVAEELHKNGVKNVHFFLGTIGVVHQASQVTRYMNGVSMGDTVWIRANDNRISVEQIARHELFHSMADRAPNMLEGVRAQIVQTLGKEKLRLLAKRYAEAYAGCYNEAELEHYIEEICADAYAGIKRFGELSREAMDALWKSSEKAQNKEKADGARAPPESRYSIERTEDGKPFVEVTEDILDGVPESEWVSTVKENLKEKFPNGITVGKNEIQIDGRSRQEMTFSRYMQWLYNNDPQLHADKLRATNNADEILLATTDWVNEGLNHPRKDRIVDFARGNVLLRVGENDYTADVVVGTKKNGSMALYDVLNLKPTSFTEKEADAAISTNPSPGAARSTASVSENSIRQNGGNVNGKFSASAEQSDAQEQQEFEDSGTMSQEKMNEYEYSGGHTLDSLPKKAQEHVRKTIRDAAFEMRRNGYQMFGADTKTLETALEGLANEYLQTGNIEAEKISEAFETVWKAGGEQAKAFRETYRQLLAKLRHMEITPSAGEQQRFDDFKAFQKQTRGKLNLVDEGGRTLREVYEEMSAAAPDLFPRSASTTQRKAMMLLLGIRRMQTVEEQLKSLKGKNAEVWKQRAATEFEASVRNMQGSFRIAQRYADAQMRTGNAFKAPESVEDVQELYKLQREQRRSYERVERQYLLTAHDQRLVNQLLRGDLRPEDVRSNENAEAILAVYEAKTDYDLTTLKITEWNKTVREQRNTEARTALGDVRTYKDKKTGLQYKRETQTRNVRDIAPEANADVITKNYFEPVRKAAADSTRLKKRFRERVNALGLKRRRNRGDTISESAAVQILGEAEDNIRVLERNRAWMEKRDGKTREEWAQMIVNLWAENPNLDKDRIRNAVKEMQSIYDELFEMMNEVRIRNGRAPINYRSGYFPHFQIGTSDGILNLMGAALGVEAGVEVLPDDALGIFKWWLKNRKELRSPDALPTEISGLTKGFKPGIQWFANALERTGGRTVYDAVQGFDRYIEGAADIICFTDSIQSLRALARQVRYLSSSEGMREQMDAIMRNNNLTEEEKEAQVDSLRKDGRYRLSKWVENLDEYANLLANKKSELDRNVESILNRSVHSFLKKWQSRVAANMVSINPGSWLTNFGVIMQAAAQMKPSTVAKAMYQQAANAWVHDGFAEHSDFLTARAGSDRLVSSWVDNASQVLSKPMELIDWYSSNVIVRARFMENIERGMSEELAMQEADQFAANVMADRSKGAMPTMFESRNPLVKVFTQFQLEVNNTFSYLFKDVPREQKKKGLGALALAWIKFLLFDWMFNEGYEALIGRRPMLDVLDLIEETGGDIFGYSRNNVIWALMNGEPVFEEKDPESVVTTAANLALNVGQELPFVGNLVGGGRLPYTSTFPDAGNIKTTLDNENLTGGQKAAKILGELKNPMAYWVLPFGGGQLKKMIEGGTAVSKGGSYKLNSKGEQELQYPVYTDRPGDKIKAWSTAMIFGKSSLKTAQDWVEDDFKRLSAKETTAYEEITKFEDQRNTFEFIKAAKQLKGKTDKLVFLDSYTGVSERAKAEYYYQAVTEGTEHEEMAAMSQQERVEHLRAAVRDAKNEQLKEGIKEDLAAGTISEQKAIQKLTANDISKSDDDAYWTVQKWMGGKDYKKYDDFLAAVDKGGDVAKAAKTYLDNGVEAKTLASQITDAYKQQYRAASEAERKRLKKLLLDAYAAIGYDRKKKEKDIDKWLKEDE